MTGVLRSKREYIQGKSQQNAETIAKSISSSYGDVFSAEFAEERELAVLTLTGEIISVSRKTGRLSFCGSTCLFAVCRSSPFQKMFCVLELLLLPATGRALAEAAAVVP